MFSPLLTRIRTTTAAPTGRARLATLVGLALTPLVLGSLVVAQADPVPQPPRRGLGWDCSCTKVLFQDYFNDPADPAWRFVNRTGLITDGRRPSSMATTCRTHRTVTATQ